MSETGPRRTGRPPRISRERVIEAALELVDETGLDGLTMRALARRLGVDPMAVYRHVRDKDDLLGAVCDAILVDLAPLDPDADWRPQLQAWATDLHDRFAARPALLPLLAGAPATPTAVEVTRSAIELLSRGGLSLELAAAAINVVFGYVVGTAVVEAAMPPAAEAGQRAGASAVEAAAAALLDEPGDFGLGLELILEGVARRAEADDPTI